MSQETFVHFDPPFVEDVVFLALRRHPEAKAFYSKRNSLYEIAGPEDRERAFEDFHRRWFIRLGLAEPLTQAIHEQPLLTANVMLCAVARAPKKAEEGAELFVRSQEGPGEKERKTVRILLRPESLLDPVALLTFLRHELMHTTDMLDPSIGYEPLLPVLEGGISHDRLLKDRYRVLWDVTIDGRMVKRGWAPESTREERLHEFCRVFPMFGEEGPQVFSRFFDREPHSHAELVAFACDPRAKLKDSSTTPHPGSRCPLCDFPTYTFEPKPEELPKQAIAQITRDFPSWIPSRGLCIQCADIYRTRAIATSPVELLPKGDLPYQD